MPVVEQDFATVRERDVAAKPEVMQRQRTLLAERYDLSDRPAAGVMMSGGRKAVQEGVRVKLPSLVVFNNNSLTFVELEMKAAGFLDYATDLHNPDFANMAEAARLLGLRAETPEQVRPMLVQALDHDGPALVEVVVNRQELAMPPSIEWDQVIGFSLYMIKAVLNGRGDELIDLAKTNFGEREWWLLYAGDVADGSQLIQHCPRAPSLPLSVAV
jgi:hypothetical protein